ncbi:MAG TPA: glycosyltransferase family 1 protein [Candidatus Obscuribacterales bacterium]
MPRLAIIDQDVAAAGGVRYSQELVRALLHLPEIKEWDVTIVARRRNSAGFDAHWDECVSGTDARLVYLRDDPGRRLFDRLSAAGRIMGIPGTSRLQQAIPRLLRRWGTRAIREYAGEVRLWIEQYLEKSKFDVAYFPFPYMMECPAVSVPLVSTPHDFNFKTMDSLDPAHRQVMEAQMSGWLERCRKLIVSSEFIRGEVARFYPQFVDKVQVVRSGIPGEDSTTSQDDVKATASKFALPDQFILITGWLLPHKNQKIVLQALARLRAKGTDIKAVLVGPNSHQLGADYTGWMSPYVRSMREEADSSGLTSGKDYLALGYVGDLELRCLYRLARLVVVPSLYEAGSFPLLEAILAGCPVVCARIPPIEEQAELLEGNVTLFDPTSADDLAAKISGILKNPEEALSQADRARLIAPRHFAWRRTAEIYLTVFTELCRQSG